MMVLLEQLNPKERAVFILSWGFDYSHQEISEVLSCAIENSRKLLSRSKRKLDLIKKLTSDQSFHRQTAADLNRYIDHIKNGNTAALEEMLSAQIKVTTDGGGRIKIVREINTGIQATSELLLYVYNAYQKIQTIQLRMINHQSALLFFTGEILINCQVFEFENNTRKITGIYSIVDPEKLRNINLAKI
ncbi:hypothetical protein H7F33_05430 [Pedobacter sp. PAMC26386]|nr:hypothetical protein H7F33_05430 [Pedobacter sp. PAMC26386]